MGSIVLSRTVTVSDSWEHVASRSAAVPGGPSFPLGDLGSLDGHLALQAVLVAACAALGDGFPSVLKDEAWHVCDDCGGYCDTTWTVIAPDGREVVRFEDDGHFGYGDKLSEIDALAVRALEAMGHDVEVVRTGEARLGIGGYHGGYQHEADHHADLASRNADLRIELVLDGSDRADVPYLDALLHRLPPVARVTVAGALVGDFREALDEVEARGERSRGHVAAFRDLIVVDGRKDQLARIPTEALADYFGEDEEGRSALHREFPRVTFGCVCEEALRRGLDLPDGKLPFTMRRAIPA